MSLWAPKELDDAAHAAKCAVRCAVRLIRAARDATRTDAEIIDLAMALLQAALDGRERLRAVVPLPRARAALEFGSEVMNAYVVPSGDVIDRVGHLCWNPPLLPEVRHRLSAIREPDAERLFAEIDAELEAAEVEAAPPAGTSPDPVALAVALLKDYPEWSARRLAESAGCAHTTLTRSALYKTAKALATDKRDRHRGRKTADGDVEAVADDE